MSGSGSSSDGSSLAGFGAELEAELLGDGTVDGGGAAYEAHARELSGAAGAADDDAEPGAKRARVDDAPSGKLSTQAKPKPCANAKHAVAAAAPAGPGAICPPHPGFMHGMCIRCCARKAERDDIDDAAVDAHVSLSCAPPAKLQESHARSRSRVVRPSRFRTTQVHQRGPGAS